MASYTRDEAKKIARAAIASGAFDESMVDSGLPFVGNVTIAYAKGADPDSLSREMDGAIEEAYKGKETLTEQQLADAVNAKIVKGKRVKPNDITQAASAAGIVTPEALSAPENTASAANTEPTQAAPGPSTRPTGPRKQYTPISLPEIGVIGYEVYDNDGRGGIKTYNLGRDGKPTDQDLLGKREASIGEADFNKRFPNTQPPAQQATATTPDAPSPNKDSQANRLLQAIAALLETFGLNDIANSVRNIVQNEAPQAGPAVPSTPELTEEAIERAKRAQEGSSILTLLGERQQVRPPKDLDPAKLVDLGGKHFAQFAEQMLSEASRKPLGDLSPKIIEVAQLEKSAGRGPFS